MSRRTDGTRRGAARRKAIIALVAVAATMAATAGLAFAQDGTTTTTTPAQGTTTTPDTTPAKGGGGTSTSGGGGGKSGGGSVRLKAESAAPSKVFFYGNNRATYRYSISGDRPRNLKIQARQPPELAGDQGVAEATTSSPGATRSRWAGTAATATAAKTGTYVFRVPHPAWRGRRSQPHQGRRPLVQLLPGQVPAAREAQLRRRLRRALAPATCTRARTSSPTAASGSSPRAAAACSTAATRRAAPATTSSSTASATGP